MKIVVTGSVSEVTARLVPAAGVKLNVAEATLRTFEKPTTVTVTVGPDWVKLTLVAVGAWPGMTTTAVCPVVGVTSTPDASKVNETVTVPATVPVWNGTVGPVVAFAAMVNGYVRLPFGNWIAGSSTAGVELGTNVSV